MPSKLNHLAITTDHYATVGMFYRAVFGMKVSGDTSREMSAISVGDGYVGMTIIPRRGGRKAGLDHFGIEVEDLDKVREKMAKKYPDIEIVKRPGNRPFASFSAHDPAGNYFDLSQQGHENRAEIYAKGEWKQDNTINHFALRARHAGKMAEFYSDMFDLEARNVSGEPDSHHLTDGRVTLSILPWSISVFEGMSIKRPGPDHIGFKVENVDAFIKHVETTAGMNPYVAPMRLGGSKEAGGKFQMADPSGVWIDVTDE